MPRRRQKSQRPLQAQEEIDLSRAGATHKREIPDGRLQARQGRSLFLLHYLVAASRAMAVD